MNSSQKRCLPGGSRLVEILFYGPAHLKKEECHADTPDGQGHTPLEGDQLGAAQLLGNVFRVRKAFFVRECPVDNLQRLVGETFEKAGDLEQGEAEKQAQIAADLCHEGHEREGPFLLHVEVH